MKTFQNFKIFKALKSLSDELMKCLEHLLFEQVFEQGFAGANLFGGRWKGTQRQRSRGSKGSPKAVSHMVYMFGLWSCVVTVVYILHKARNDHG